ncbi:Tyrosine aminotransferase [Quillaja saponaria]|uniref:Tyrosine aminotransferase n=1 Tax=Quillaja saponaria TaxID=32244 RepID=A0AAD7PAE5_QUISA|nr:Tyrosine aminotransferase [Quillaja saponaria]
MNHKTRKWNFKGNEEQELVISMNSALRMLEENLNKEDQKPSIFLGYADPAGIFQTDPLAADAIADAVRSFQFNYYPPAVGVLEARRAIAKHLSCDLPYQLSPDDVFLTLGSIQAIEIITSIVAQPGANILLPRPGYPPYEANAVSNGLEVRQFDLIPEKGWEVDLDSVEAVADDNTVAMVMINPCNPCGNVFTYQHLKQVAETARKLGVFVISDEAFGLVTFGSNPFVPMGVFGTIVPVLTIGTLSKRWVVPGWRLGWIVTNEPNGFFEESGIVESIKNHLEVTSNPPTFLQGAIPQIFEQVK